MLLLVTGKKVRPGRKNCFACVWGVSSTNLKHVSADKRGLWEESVRKQVCELKCGKLPIRLLCDVLSATLYASSFNFWIQNYIQFWTIYSAFTWHGNVYDDAAEWRVCLPAPYSRGAGLKYWHTDRLSWPEGVPVFCQARNTEAGLEVSAEKTKWACVLMSRHQNAGQTVSAWNMTDPSKFVTKHFGTQ
jgi:hypothetical protein